MARFLRYDRLVLFAALGIHLGAVGAVHLRMGRVDAWAFESLDAREYYRIARNLAEHGRFSQDEGEPFTPDTWRTPGYPLFLASLMLLLGTSPAVLVIVQHLLGVLNAYLLYVNAERRMSPRRAAVAAVLFAMEPYQLYYTFWLLATTWFVTVAMLLWWAWDRAIRRADAWPYGAAGLLAGLWVLVRPVAAFVPLLLLAGLIWHALRGRRRDSGAVAATTVDWRCVGLFAAGVVVAVAPWMARNRFVAGHFALSDQAGVVLAYFKAAEVVLWRDGRAADRYIETSLDPRQRDAPHTVWDSIDARLQDRFAELPAADRSQLTWPNLAQGNRTPLDSFHISRELARIGWSELTRSPLDTAICYAARSAAALTFPLNLVLFPAQGIAKAGARRWLLSLPYVALLGAVIVRLSRGSWSFAGMFFPAACLLALLAATAPQLDPRFRVPMVAMLLVLALLPTQRGTRPGRDVDTGAQDPGSR